MHRHLFLVLGLFYLSISIYGISHQKRPVPPPIAGPCGIPLENYSKGTCKAALSCWLVENQRWKTQPILLVNGEQYSFSTPRQYAAKMKEVREQPYCMYNPKGARVQEIGWRLMMNLDEWDKEIRKLEFVEF